MSPYDETTGAWSRSIAGFGGLLATEEQGKQAVLQLRDLDGDIVGTASLSEAESKPLSTERSTTFGVPVSEKPVDKYNWLGASGLTASLPSGAVVQDGKTYVPQLGASLQTEAATAAAVDNVVAAPVVITMAPPTDCKYEEGILPAEEAATPAGEIPEPGGEVLDPRGLMTGQEALEFAKTLEGDASGLADAFELENSCSSEECVQEYETGIAGDKYLASLLNECYHQVHTPRKVNGVLVTRMCLVHFGYQIIDGYLAIKPIGTVIPSVSYCFSEDLEDGKTRAGEWYCYEDKTWWKYHRGWVFKL